MIVNRQRGQGSMLPGGENRDPVAERLGLRFNPFTYLEASADPHLGEYVVVHDLGTLTRDETPALFLAPAGGGKTALRIYTIRACWIGLGGAHPFPLSYLLSHHRDGHPPTPQSHLRGIARAGASTLLISLAFRPELALALDSADRRALVALLQAALPSPLPRYLDLLREEQNPLPLLRLLDRSYRLPGLPQPAALRELCDMLVAQQNNQLQLPPEQQFAQLQALLLGPLGFRSIFVLIDGVDASPETIADPALMADWLAWPLEQIKLWASQRVFLKGFLPIEIGQALTTRLPGLADGVQQATLEWTTPLLAELIRRRIYTASLGEFGSLDALASPDLRDLDTQLARRALPRPRELLVLVNRMLDECLRRCQNGDAQIEPADLQTATVWYRSQQ